MMQFSVQTLLERERAFTRYASHELRTPLSTFKVQLEALELGLSPVEQVLPVLERNALRMEGVLTALLALALSGERNPEHTALKPLLRAFFGTLAPEARARLKRRGDLGDHVRVADAHLIVQVMHNLIENPLRYSEGDVIFCAEVRGRALFFSVRDFGPGVPEDTLKGLTRPFYRCGGHRESLGLGLALVESISRSLSGTLELRNANPGLEARFTVPLDPTS